MRKINEIIIHCSATREGVPFTVSDIRHWHLCRGYVDIGYHYVIYLDGSVHKGRDIERVGAHCLGHNAYSVGICYIGGLDENGNPKNTMTSAQEQSLIKLICRLKDKYPTITELHGHNEFANASKRSVRKTTQRAFFETGVQKRHRPQGGNKACPCFNVQEWAMKASPRNAGAT